MGSGAAHGSRGHTARVNCCHLLEALTAIKVPLPLCNPFSPTTKPQKLLSDLTTKERFLARMTSYLSFMYPDQGGFYAGFMPHSSAVQQSQANALARTAQLAASQPSTGSPSAILASTASGGSVLAAMPILAASSAGTGADPAVAQLRAAANAACAAGNFQQCSALNQQLGSLQASITCPGGSWYEAFQAQKAKGSVGAYFNYPTYVSGTKPTTTDVASVAVSLAAV